MAEDHDGTETGGALRKKLEDALEANKQLSERLRGYEVQNLIKDKGWATVKPEDFEGVELTGLEEHGNKLHEQRVGLVKDLLSRQGLEGDDLEKQVSAFLAGKPAVTEDPAGLDGVTRVRELTGIAGEPASRTKAAELHGEAAIEAAFAAQQKS